MKIRSFNVEELSREMEQNKLISIQEVLNRPTRQWVFKGERLIHVREQKAENASFPAGADVYLVCDDERACQQYAAEIAKEERTVRYLAGGYLAWNQFYHPIVVGFDERVKIWQIHRLAKGCLSYMITSGEEAMIIDPSYHIDFYLGLAHGEQADITCVVDTQVYRDHVSGGPRLAAKTKSSFYVPSHDQLQADSEPLEEQAHLTLGQARIDVIEIPSHTAAEEKRVGLLINEQFLFSGDMPLQDDEFREKLAEDGHLQQASDQVIVLPAHTHDLAIVNDHGIVAATLGELKGGRQSIEAYGQSIAVNGPQSIKGEIYDINLSQREIDLDKANELELGVQDERQAADNEV